MKSLKINLLAQNILYLIRLNKKILKEQNK